MLAKSLQCSSNIPGTLYHLKKIRIHYLKHSRSCDMIILNLWHTATGLLTIIYANGVTSPLCKLNNEFHWYLHPDIRVSYSLDLYLNTPSWDAVVLLPIVWCENYYFFDRTSILNYNKSCYKTEFRWAYYLSTAHGWMDS